MNDISIEECQKSLSERLWKTKYDALAFSGAGVHAQSIGIDPSFRISLCENPTLNTRVRCKMIGAIIQEFTGFRDSSSENNT